MSLYDTPPKWAKNAVASPRGWRHPETGELLVSIKLDMSKFDEKVVEETIIEEQPPTGTLTDPEVAKAAAEAVFQDKPEYFKEEEQKTEEAPKAPEQRVKRAYNRKQK